MRVRGWAVSDVGRRRDHNEDSYLCSDEMNVYAVADGMGGHLGGERASRMAVDILERDMKKACQDGRLSAASTRPEPAPASVAAVGVGAGTPPAETGTPVAGAAPPGAGSAVHPASVALRAATLAADLAIFELSREDEALQGMGTTLTGMVFHGRHVTLCHVGDSRAFLYRDGRARQLTEDHSWIQEQVRAGLISPEEARESRFRNIITRSVGFEPAVAPDILTMPVETGDCFMLCSDGLSNYVSCDEIGQILTSQFYRDAPRAFVDTANERGGDDNITCVVVYVANER